MPVSTDTKPNGKLAPSRSTNRSISNNDAPESPSSPSSLVYSGIQKPPQLSAIDETVDLCERNKQYSDPDLESEAFLTLATNSSCTQEEQDTSFETNPTTASFRSQGSKRKLLEQFRLRKRPLPNLVTRVDPAYLRQVRCERNTRICLILFSALLAALILAIIFVPIEMASRSRAAQAKRTNLTQRSATTGQLTLEQNDQDWWRKYPIYQIYPRSFMDANGDGTGDLRGIISKLDYLETIGVRSVWLSPIYKSPMADFGYDVSDFREIDPIFGSLADFEELVQEMHTRKMYLIMDFIPNHSSNQHPWFLESAKSKTGQYADYYVWHDGTRNKPPNNWLGHFGGSAWTWSEVRQQWYLHQFLPEQPDLNYRNSNVRAEMEAVLEYWVELGVDGFRVDAVNHLFEDPKFRDEPKNPNKLKSTKPNEHRFLEHIHTKDQEENFAVIRSWTKLLAGLSRKHHRKVFMMTEAYTSLENQMKFYDAGVDFPFNFNLMGLNKDTTGKELAETVQAYMKQINGGQRRTKDHNRHPNWVLSNHDNSRICSRLGGQQYADVANMLLLTLPGTPTVYYGDELGMVDINVSFAQTQDPYGKRFGASDYRKHSRDPERSPMQWSSQQNAGFSTSSPWLPVAPSYASVNVENQLKDPSSALNLFRKLVELRKPESPVFGNPNSTNLSVVDLKEGNLFCYVRSDFELQFGDDFGQKTVSRASKSDETAKNIASDATDDSSFFSHYVVVLNFGNDGDSCSLKELGRHFSGSPRPTVVLSSGNLQLQTGATVDVTKLALTDAHGLILLYKSAKKPAPSAGTAAQQAPTSSRLRRNKRLRTQ